MGFHDFMKGGGLRRPWASIANPIADEGRESRAVYVRYGAMEWVSKFRFDKEGSGAWGAGDSYAKAVVGPWLAQDPSTEDDFIDLFGPRGLIVQFTPATRREDATHGAWTATVYRH